MRQRVWSSEDSPNPDQEPANATSPDESLGRIVFINPLTQGMVVIEGSPSRLESLLRDLVSKDEPPPASRKSIEAMPCLEIKEGHEGGECVICLEEWEIGGLAKQMPCKHRFHGECIDKWLGIHGSCPVCRFKMPVDEDDGGKKSGVGRDERERRRRREIWVSFSFNRERSGDSNQTPSGSDQTMEG
ncbi:E3 ubiquitin-protein ligase MPSR1-like isoform X2 [Diospyros lotus]|uniref:E3 ubiquitin-protein ligase MPSR1-like isoform X2 n=1 Tax=Diospyros lotus TaxID=55363 RepID=UPI002258FF6B|nr:E3 ubiquitin-protein ligase MPSR1-like isoform X2 [Diospyros lotus]XP_052186151.1 E3 ubiquitin-protein ligase MPSR1-like isoform X2 [Diospyros lotus]